MSGKTGSGKPKDGRKNPSWGNLQMERTRSNFKMVGIPCFVFRKPEETKQEGLLAVEELKQIEAQLTEWEDKQTTEFLELLPWWEERKKYRALKLTGKVPEVQWWEALAFLEASHPKRLDDAEKWGLYTRPGKKKKAP